MKPDRSRDLVRAGARVAFIGAWLLSLMFLAGGCATATTFEVKVAVLPAPAPVKATSYRIIHPVAAPKDQALYDETTRVVRRALATKGMKEVKGTETPDLLVLFSSGQRSISTRQTTVREPHYVSIPSAARTETVQVGNSANGTPLYQTVTRVDPPIVELVGHRDRPVTVTTFRKTLSLRALEYRPSAGKSEMAENWAHSWGIDATYESEDGNLREALPLLAAAGIARFGQTAPGTIPIQLKDTDTDVVAIKRGR